MIDLPSVRTRSLDFTGTVEMGHIQSLWDVVETQTPSSSQTLCPERAMLSSCFCHFCLPAGGFSESHQKEKAAEINL
jgi:hypothetical protein